MKVALAPVFYSYETIVKRHNSLFTFIGCGLIVVIVASVVLSIATRQFGYSLLWAGDVAQISFSYLAFLAFGPALASGHHISVELFEPLVPAWLRRRLDVIAASAIIIFGAVFLFQLWKVTGRSFSDGRVALMMIPIQLKWIQLAGMIGMTQFCLTALLHLGIALGCRGSEQNLLHKVISTHKEIK